MQAHKVRFLSPLSFRVKDIHTEQVNQWLEEDFEWPNRPNTGGHLVGSSSTTVLTGTLSKPYSASPAIGYY